MKCQERLSKDTFSSGHKKEENFIITSNRRKVTLWKVLPKLVDDITIKQNKEIDTAIMDGSYDSNKNFQLLSFKGIKPAIKVRKNSRCRKTNHYLRNKAVMMQKNNLQNWKNSVRYGQRWIVEAVFSCIKRMFGEYVTAIRFENMIKEMILKASLYNLFQSIIIR